MANNIIAVNIGKSINVHKTVIESARGHWRPIGRATESEVLQQAQLVVAIKNNTIKGVFLVKGVQQDLETLRYEYDLTEATEYRSLEEYRTTAQTGPYWARGDLAGWKRIHPSTFMEMVAETHEPSVKLGSHEVRLLPNGDLEVMLGGGGDVRITSR